MLKKVYVCFSHKVPDILYEVILGIAIMHAYGLVYLIGNILMVGKEEIGFCS